MVLCSWLVTDINRIEEINYIIITHMADFFIVILEKKKIEEDDDMAELAAWAN